MNHDGCMVAIEREDEERLRMSYLIGIDIGTSGTKTILVDPEGNVLARAVAEYPLYAPKPQWSEQNPEDWWRATCATVQEV